MTITLNNATTQAPQKCLAKQLNLEPLSHFDIEQIATFHREIWREEPYCKD